MKVLLTIVTLAMIVYVQGQDGGCVKVACDIAFATQGCVAQCGGSGAGDTDLAYAVSLIFFMLGSG